MLQTFDDIMIDRIFQPVVDRFELDRDKTVRNLIATMIICCFAQGFLLWRNPLLAVITIAPTFMFIGAWRAGRFMPRFGYASLRTLFVLAVALLISSDIDDLIRREWPVATLSLVGHAVLIMAFYVAACSKPPPRRRRAPVWAVSAT